MSELQSCANCGEVNVRIVGFVKRSSWDDSEVVFLVSYEGKEEEKRDRMKDLEERKNTIKLD